MEPGSCNGRRRRRRCRPRCRRYLSPSLVTSIQQQILIGCRRRDNRPYTSVRRSDPRAKGRIAIDSLAEIHIAVPENWVHRINLTLMGVRPSLKGGLSISVHAPGLTGEAPSSCRMGVSPDKTPSDCQGRRRSDKYALSPLTALPRTQFLRGLAVIKHGGLVLTPLQCQCVPLVVDTCIEHQVQRCASGSQSRSKSDVPIARI